MTVDKAVQLAPLDAEPLLTMRSITGLEAGQEATKPFTPGARRESDRDS